MDLKFRNNNLLLLGDSHDLRRTFIIIQRTPNIDNFDIIFLGDGGEGFCGRGHDEVYFKRINDECIKRNIRLFCIRGNHSNPEVWQRNYQFSNLFLVPDYSSAEFPNGKTALLVGGGISIDRFYRKQDIDYWADEITTYQKVDKKYDILFCHDAPSYFNHSTESLPNSPYGTILKDDLTLYEDCLNQRNTIDKIVKDINCEYCYSGHFHRSISEYGFGIAYRCLTIEEIFEINTNDL